MTTATEAPPARSDRLGLDLLPERLRRKIIVDVSGCWLWTASVGSAGYGQAWTGVTMARAHRVVYEILVDTIPAELECDHTCRVRRCVNPRHIDLVTHAENMRRLHGDGGSQTAAERTRRYRARLRAARAQAVLDAGGWVVI